MAREAVNQRINNEKWSVEAEKLKLTSLFDQISIITKLIRLTPFFLLRKRALLDGISLLKTVVLIDRWISVVAYSVGVVLLYLQSRGRYSEVDISAKSAVLFIF